MTVFSFSLLFKELKDLETQKESLEIQNEESIMSYYKMRQQINRLGDEMLVGVALIVVNPVTPKSYQHLISPYNNTLESNKGHENRGDDHQLKQLLIIKQILFVSTLGNVW